MLLCPRKTRKTRKVFFAKKSYFWNTAQHKYLTRNFHANRSPHPCPSPRGRGTLLPLSRERDFYFPSPFGRGAGVREWEYANIYDQLLNFSCLSCFSWTISKSAIALLYCATIVLATLQPTQGEGILPAANSAAMSRRCALIFAVVRLSANEYTSGLIMQHGDKRPCRSR